MGRHKGQVSRDGGLSKRRGTPVKAALSRRDKCERFVHYQRYETFPQQAEGEMNVATVKPVTLPVWRSINPALGESVLCSSSSPSFTENPRDEPAGSTYKRSGCRASPAGRPTVHTIPEPVAFNGGEMVATPENNTSSGMVSDTASSSDDDDDGEEYGYSSVTSSSLPSPEIFRRERHVETLPFKEERLHLHPRSKNSTLLDMNHAQSIDVFHSPDLSDIIDASTILPEKICEINKNRGAEAETKMHTGSFKPGEAIKWKTPPKLTNRRPISYKKKVCFKNPIVTEIFEAKRTPTAKSSFLNTTEPPHEPAHEPAHAPRLAERTQPLADPFRADEISSNEEESHLRVTLKRPVKSSPEKVKFFDFVDAGDREAFFKTMRERCFKLSNAPCFPLTASEYAEPPVL